MSAGESVGNLIDVPERGDLDGASNVMVVSASLADGARRAYFDTLLPDDSSRCDILAVEYRRTPEQYLDEWDRYRAESPRRFDIITVDESPNLSPWADVDRGAVTGVDSPSDLTGVGMKVERYLDSLGGSETLVTFESLTVLLQYVDIRWAFRFLNTIASRVRQLDAVAHYHVDPNAHDDQVLATLASLCDGVARFQDDGWETRRR